MRNKSFKMSIINDYTKILSAKNFCDSFLTMIEYNNTLTIKLKDTSNYAASLLQTYKKIMFKLGLIDISLALIDRQMLDRFINNRQTFAISKNEIEDKLKEINLNLTQIAQNLKIKIKKMELNNFELNYLNIDKLSKNFIN